MDYQAQVHAVHCFKSSLGLSATVLITSKCLLQRWMVHPEVIYCQQRLIIIILLGKMHSQSVSSPSNSSYQMCKQVVLSVHLSLKYDHILQSLESQENSRVPTLNQVLSQGKKPLRYQGKEIRWEGPLYDVQLISKSFSVPMGI